MSGSEGLSLKELGEIYLDEGKDKATSQAERAVKDVLDGDLAFMSIETPEVTVENPNESSDYHAIYRPSEDRISFSPSMNKESPALRETSIHELFHKHQDIKYFGLSESEISYKDALESLAHDIARQESEDKGIINKFRKKTGLKSRDVESQKMFLQDAIGIEGGLTALFTLYSSKYDEELDEMVDEASEYYNSWKSVQEDRNRYRHLVGMAETEFDVLGEPNTELREVEKIEEHKKAVERSTDKGEIRTHLKAIDKILDENDMDYSAPGELGKSTLEDTVDAEKMAKYNETTKESLEGFRKALIDRLDSKDDIKNPVPKYFQEAFAHAASVIATGKIGDSEDEEKYWKNKVEIPYNLNFSYSQNAGTKARKIGEEVLEQVRDLETDREKYRKLVEIQDQKVENYRITV